VERPVYGGHNNEAVMGVLFAGFIVCVFIVACFTRPGGGGGPPSSSTSPYITRQERKKMFKTDVTSMSSSDSVAPTESPTPTVIHHSRQSDSGYVYRSIPTPPVVVEPQRPATVIVQQPPTPVIVHHHAANNNNGYVDGFVMGSILTSRSAPVATHTHTHTHTESSTPSSSWDFPSASSSDNSTTHRSVGFGGTKNR
jgi:hypothetical protein